MYIIVLGYSMKVIYVFICILISMNLGKILFMEKLDVIKKIFWLDSNIFIVIIFLNSNNVYYL